MTYVSKSAKELKRNWPNVSGLIAGTTKQEGRVTNLIPQVSSLVLDKEKVGIR